MTDKQFIKLIEPIKKYGHDIPTLGYRISFAQFCQIAEAMASHIYKMGWTHYKDYIDSWTLKVDDKEKLKGIY